MAFIKLSYRHIFLNVLKGIKQKETNKSKENTVKLKKKENLIYKATKLSFQFIALLDLPAIPKQLKFVSSSSLLHIFYL